jgi:hypothetical protein
MDQPKSVWIGDLQPHWSEEYLFAAFNAMCT